MPKEHDVLVVAGQAGSKSTFIGGLYKHAFHQDNLDISYQPVEGNITEDFTNGLIKAMLTRHVYPDQTAEGYVVSLKLDGGGTAIPSTAFKFVDIPGEQIDAALPKMKSDLRRGGINEEFVDKEFQSIRQKIGGNEQLNADEWKIVLEHYYTDATMVIFLLNIHKLLVAGKPLTIDTEWLEMVSNDKVKTAVVLTAVDLIDYDPDSPDYVNKFGITARRFDKGLIDTVEDQIELTASPEANNILTHIKSNDQIDLFSVCVPPENPGNPDSDRLKSDPDEAFVTAGFQEVISWLDD